MLLTSGHEVVGDVGSSTVFRRLGRHAKSEFGVFAFPEKTPTVSLGRAWAVSRPRSLADVNLGEEDRTL